MRLSADVLAECLNVEKGDLKNSLFEMDVPFVIRRRGVEIKIVAGETTAVPDATLIRALCNAHDWVRQMKDSTSTRQVADSASMSVSYIARILHLAFLSPRIQQAILAGTQPVELTLETTIRTRLPMGWPNQERLLGFVEIT